MADQQSVGEMVPAPKPRPRPPAAGMGRVKGVPNKNTKMLKDMIMGALDKAGGEKWLLKLAKNEPKAFAGLLGRVLPLHLNHSGSIDTNKAENLTDEQIAERLAALQARRAAQNA